MTAESFDDNDEYEVGYRRPPLHSRFQPGQSGNPSGRPKGAQNFRSLFQKIMKEQISLREGDTTKKISKAEAILRGLAISAMKGDARSLMALFKLAEHTGEYEDATDNKTEVVIRWARDEPAPDEPGGRRLPGISQLSRD
jgi:hypothetical protein